MRLHVAGVLLCRARSFSATNPTDGNPRRMISPWAFLTARRFPHRLPDVRDHSNFMFPRRRLPPYGLAGDASAGELAIDEPPQSPAVRTSGSQGQSLLICRQRGIAHDFLSIHRENQRRIAAGIRGKFD